MRQCDGTEEQRQVDLSMMQRALLCARRGLGTTSPNPPVGALVVREGRILGEGWHEKAGEAHAERRALADARARGFGDRLRGATLYVTLEPCSSYGRTPPCTEAILEAGIARVVYGAVDPDERHRGRADALLRAAGVEVCAGLAQEPCEALLRPWMQALRRSRPWVVAKMACTLDGSLARPHSRYVSCPESQREVHELRLHSDAILVGGQTLRSDDPSLTIRCPISPVPAVKQQPWRVVLTRDRASLPASARVFTDAHAARTLLYEQVDDLAALLHELYRERGVVQLMLECGGALLRRFLEARLVDEWMQVVAPVLAGDGLPLVPGGFLPEEVRVQITRHDSCGCDRIVGGLLQYGGENQAEKFMK